MKISLITASVIFAVFSEQIAYSQDKSGYQFGKITPADFRLPKSPAIDSNSNAVCLADMGKTGFKGNNKGWFDYIYTRTSRMLVLNNQGVDVGTIKFVLFKLEDEEEKVEELTAGAYNLENGNIEMSKLSASEVFKERIDKHHIEVKFTVPGVKPGSIIEYSYTIRSGFDFNLPSWSFQNLSFPVLYSEYQVSIPAIFSYAFLRQGFGKFYAETSWEGRENYLVTSPAKVGYGSLTTDLNVGSSTGNYRWIMRDEPALAISPDDKFIFCSSDYLDKIEFQLNQVRNGETTTDVKNTWEKATEELLTDDIFAGQLRDENLWLDESLKTICEESGNALSDAKSIYYYLIGHFTCTNHNDYFVHKSLWAIFREQSGTVGELNMLLTAMLRHRNLEATPVILSTREHGLNYAKYPMLDRMNYVICKVSINNTVYFLDAAHPKLGFGKIALNCFNGPARKISKSDSGTVYFSEDSLMEKKYSNVWISSEEKSGKLKGTFRSVPGYYESYQIRETALNNGGKEIFSNYRLASGINLSISDEKIDSLNKLEDPVNLSFNFEIPTGDEKLLYVNPMLFAGYSHNPFVAMQRNYPVEMPYPFDQQYIFSLEIPEEYTIDELPKSNRVAYNENEGLFEYLVGKDETHVQVRMHFKMNKSVYLPLEYNVLRDFYAFVIKKMSEQIVLRKLDKK